MGDRNHCYRNYLRTSNARIQVAKEIRSNQHRTEGVESWTDGGVDSRWAYSSRNSSSYRLVHNEEFLQLRRSRRIVKGNSYVMDPVCLIHVHGSFSQSVAAGDYLKGDYSYAECFHRGRRKWYEGS